MHRIELSDGQLPDMACGFNGVARQTWFRPSHIVVGFDPQGVVETRIYGRQIKRDGSAPWVTASWNTGGVGRGRNCVDLVRSADVRVPTVAS